VSFILPFEKEICELDERLARLPAGSPEHAEKSARLGKLEREIYQNLNPHELFMLSGHPLRPKALDYVQHIFHDVRLYYNPKYRGDHLMIAGEGQVEIDGKSTEVVIIGQQTGPSSNREELLHLPIDEYKRWNQGMGFPDGYRKAVYFMELAEQRGCPVVVFVDTPGADPSAFSEEEGQAFAINEVIRKTTSLKTHNLAYIISLGASGGAIAITPTNRTIMNQYATYMVISPGGCASILFRNRSIDSIRKAAEGLCLTSADALRQNTVDEIVSEGSRPGHRYQKELLEAGKQAVVRHLSEMLQTDPEAARRAKFFAMGEWDEVDPGRQSDSLAKRAAVHARNYQVICEQISTYLAHESTKDVHHSGKPNSPDALATQEEGRRNVARLIYAIEHRDKHYVAKALNSEPLSLSHILWTKLRAFVLARRYGNMQGAPSLRPAYVRSAYDRLHPIDAIRVLTDPGSFREFEETMAYCSIDHVNFPKYHEALVRGMKLTRLHSSLITGDASIGGHPAVLAMNNFGLVGSSLCDEIGEKFRVAARRALEARLPMVTYSMGGGARMQEGTPSMHRNIPKIQHALNELYEAGLTHISIIADPTLGGTAISYGLRGDYMIVVEGSANIGFSGRRVVEQFQQRQVAPDFQRETWLLQRGFVDECVEVERLAERIAELLKHVADGKKLTRLQTRKRKTWKPAPDRVVKADSRGGKTKARTLAVNGKTEIRMNASLVSKPNDVSGRRSKKMSAAPRR